MKLIKTFEAFEHRVGEKHNTKDGEVEIIEYNNSIDCAIKFQDGTILKKVPYGSVKRGTVRKPTVRPSRVGEKYITGEGLEIEIIEYNNYKDCTIKFQDGFIVRNIRYDNVQRGEVKNTQHLSVGGVGYFGAGNSKSYQNDKQLPGYKMWNQMIHASYNDKSTSKRTPDKDWEVCKEWQNYQTFAKWYDENYINGFSIDKNIIKKGNKLYCPEYCTFVPIEIANVFNKAEATRGDCPIGVYYEKSRNKYRAYVNINSKSVKLGRYSTPEEAFLVHKKAKEEYIKLKADKYIDQITPETYNALYNYQVEITD